MKKRIILTLVVAIILACLLAVGVSARDKIDSGKCGDNLTWTLYDDGELVINGTGAMKNYTHQYDSQSYKTLTTAPWGSYYDKLKKLTIANGVTIGTNYKDVLKIFDIQDGYAIANMEVETKQQDGTTDIIEKTYRNKSIFKKDYLDLYLLFGYKKINKEWKMVTAKELKKLMDTNKELLVFYIDFNGMDNEVVNPGEVISFSVTHQ